jgi:hypothetical protein
MTVTRITSRYASAEWADRVRSRGSHGKDGIDTVPPKLYP